MTDHPGLNDDEGIAVGQGLKSALTANKLRKRARLTFRPTDDLRSHLRLDRNLHVVEIFPHTTFPEGAFETDQGPGQCDLGGRTPKTVSDAPYSAVQHRTWGLSFKYD
jgi:hypothetical protein